MKSSSFVLICLMLTSQLFAKGSAFLSINADTTHKPNEWYKKVSLRGYTQVRYNRLLETNKNLHNDANDKSWGDNGGITIRRSRLAFTGNVSDRMTAFVQLDIANQVSGSINNIHFVQIRDCYTDLMLDSKKEFRLRIGQSKVPYGFENMQSSANRIAMDRTDAINSGVPNERDMGVFGYWATAKMHERFAYLVSSGLKGSGDYGMVGIGVYNGQTANKVEANNDQHVVIHLAYPFLLMKKQYVELGAHAYSGMVAIDKSAKTKSATTNFLDQRACGSLVVYPQPLGFQAEYNVGKGPEFRSSDTSIQLSKLKGGYVQMMYMYKHKTQQIVPFIRYQFYEGGRKNETDARSYSVHDIEIGAEWTPMPNFEFTANYTISERRYEDFAKPINTQKGNLLRLQAQFSF